MSVNYLLWQTEPNKVEPVAPDGLLRRTRFSNRFLVLAYARTLESGDIPSIQFMRASSLQRCSATFLESWNMHEQDRRESSHERESFLASVGRKMP